MSTSSESFPLVADAHLIEHLAGRQAGSSGKALTELAQNGYDAGSPDIHFTLTTEGFVATTRGRTIGEDDDDGRLSEEAAVHRNLGRVGAPHRPRDVPIGEFRAGRLQVMSLAATRWYSGNFVVEFDHPHLGWNYRLEPLEHPVPGCHIEGHWFRPLLPNEVTALTRSLKRLLAFAPLTVYVNGEQITTSIDRAPWTLKLPEGRFRERGVAGLDVFNLGFYVTTLDGARYGNGVVVTTLPLRLDLSRTIIDHTCPVWNAIGPKLEARQTSKALSPAPLADHDRRHLAYRWREGHVPLEALLNVPLLTDINRRSISLARLGEATAVAVDNPTRPLARVVHARGLALVLHPRTLSRFNVSSLAEFLALLQKREPNYAPFAQLRITTVDACLDAGAVEKRLCPAESWSKQEQVAISAFTAPANDLAAVVSTSLDLPVRAYQISVGEADASVRAWLEGETLALNRLLLGRVNEGFGPFALIADAILHCILCSVLPVDTEGRCPEADLWMDRLMAIPEGDVLCTLTETPARALEAYVVLCRAAGVKVSATIVRSSERNADQRGREQRLAEVQRARET